MIKPSDLENRGVVHAPLDRRPGPNPAPADDEHDRSTPGEPCLARVPPAVEHGEREGGKPDQGPA